MSVVMETATLLIVGLFLCLSTSSADEIRCYCNAASCVSTGYMCKSLAGRCFSQLSFDERPESVQHVHGCIEDLQLAHRDACVRDGQMYKPAAYDTWPITMCCAQDMCNYIGERPEVVIDASAVNDTVSRDDSRSNADAADSRLGDDDAQISDRDLWFKAAVIAVPISGGFILVLLVLLAVRMLRTDHRRQRHLVHASRQQRSLTKAEMFAADRFYHQTESECLNSPSKVNSASSLAQVHNEAHYHCDYKSHHHHHYRRRREESTDTDRICPGRTGGHTGRLHRDINVKKTERCHGNSRHGYEKIRPGSETSSGPEGSVSSVILWAGPSDHGSALRPHCITDV